jgi:uncharacterized protein
MKSLQEKYDNLKEYIKSLGSVAVAFSSGVDSTFLLKVAHEVLGDKAIAVTARSCSFPERELREAWRLTAAKRNRAQGWWIPRSWKSKAFARIRSTGAIYASTSCSQKWKAIAAEEGLREVAEGSNMDDLGGDYRPGLEAIRETGVKSPLGTRGFPRMKSGCCQGNWGSPHGKKQSFACLASRFPYGESITAEKLRMVDEAEQLLLDPRIPSGQSPAPRPSGGGSKFPRTSLQKSWKKRSGT